MMLKASKGIFAGDESALASDWRFHGLVLESKS
jgi:hypothetical protein